MSADRCRELAADCVRLAQGTENASEKALLLEMAERWRLLAKQLDERPRPGDRVPSKIVDPD